MPSDMTGTVTDADLKQAQGMVGRGHIVKKDVLVRFVEVGSVVSIVAQQLVDKRALRKALRHAVNVARDPAVRLMPDQCVACAEVDALLTDTDTP